MQKHIGLAKAIKLASVTMIMGAVMLPLSAAQAEEAQLDAPMAVEEMEEEVEEVFVTGSRIQRSSVDTLGPMTVITSDIIENSGATSIEEILNDMPSISLNGTNANDANGGKGTHFAAIHNLLEEQTLVLVNGRRFVPTILGSGMATDLNNIPTKMIDRIEVLADGASAVYGSDAVAGVINIILKKNMEEGILEVGGGITSRSDRETKEFSITKGGSIGERGSFVAGLTYVDRAEVLMKDRSWAKTPLVADFGDGALLIGSGIPPEGRFSRFLPSTTDTTQYTEAQITAFSKLDEDDANYYAGGTQQVGDADAYIKGVNTNYIFNAAGDAIEEYSTYDASQGHRFNYNTGEGDIPADLVNANENINTFFSGQFDINSNTTAFAELALSKREGDYQMMGLPISGSHGKYTDMIPVPLTNGNLPASVVTLLNEDPVIAGAGQFEYTWRSQDLGQRFLAYEGSTTSLMTGLEGSIEDWDWATHIGYGKSELDETTLNQVNVTNLRTAVDPATCAADAACASAFASTNGAIDIFGRNTYTQAQKDYVLFTDKEKAKYEQTQFAVSASSELLELPAGYLGFATGLEYRKEEGSSSRSDVTESGDSGGSFAAPTNGSYNVAEVFVEFNVPLLSGHEFAEELSLDIAARYSDYSTFGGEGTYRFGVSYAPVDGIRFRSVSSTAYRAPNIMDLYGGTSDDYKAVSDPCSDYANKTDATLIANCQAAGVPSNYLQDSAQLRLSKGGNEELQPETANTITFGVAITAIENLSFTIDYYNVEIDDAIGFPVAADVISNCYNTPGLANTECSRITRNDQGKITSFNLLNENLDKVKSEGIDITLSYTLELGAGDLNINWLGSQLIEYSETTVDGVTNDKTDKVYCSSCDDSMYPEFRSNLSVGFEQENWGVMLTHRYLPEMEIVALFGEDDIFHGTQSDAMNYFDLVGHVDLQDNLTVIAGVDNITDEDPFAIGDVSNNTSDAYDWLGTYFYGKVQYKF